MRCNPHMMIIGARNVTLKCAVRTDVASEEQRKMRREEAAGRCDQRAERMCVEVIEQHRIVGLGKAAGNIHGDWLLVSLSVPTLRQATPAQRPMKRIADRPRNLHARL